MSAPQVAGGDSLEAVDELGELDFRRVVDEEVDVVLFAVEAKGIRFGNTATQTPSAAAADPV